MNHYDKPNPKASGHQGSAQRGGRRAPRPSSSAARAMAIHNKACAGKGAK